MFGVSQEIVNQIAEMPTEHSWLLPLMKLPEWEADKAMLKVEQWVETLTKVEKAQWGVSRFLPNLLEQKAILKYLTIHPEMYRVMQLITTPEEAAEMWDAEMNYLLTTEEKEEIKRVLHRILEEELRPIFYI